MRIYQRVFLGALLVCLLVGSTYGQDVDPITGRAIINIPLGEISAVDLSVSVGLSHHGGALKVGESSGNAGMGWSVVAGGYVSREVRGLPDDYNYDTRKGWLFNSNAQNIQSFTSGADDDLNTCGDENSDWTFINNLSYVRDPEPDIYYFQAPGISGKFIFGADGLPKLIPYQDLKIVATNGMFVITTNDGMEYVFSDTETVTRQAVQFKPSTPVDYFKSKFNFYQTPLTYITTWNLSSVKSTASGTTAFYSYSAGEQSLSSEYFTGIKGTSLQVDTLFYLRDLVSPRLLTNISLKSYYITFTWANELVNKITMGEWESGDVKEYAFVYKSIRSTTGNGLIRKPFLTQVRQENSCVAFPSYVFNYNNVDTTTLTIPIPFKTGWGRDYFGYYNGRAANKNIPTVYYYADQIGGKRFRVTPIPGQPATDTFEGVSGENMAVNGSYSIYGTLARIDYPTGGATGFIYEPNTYLDATTGEQLLGPGLRISSIVTGGGDVAYGKPSATNPTWHVIKRTYEYSTADTSSITSGKINYPPVLGFTDGVNFYRSQTDLGPGSEVLYSRVKESITGQGYRVYEFDLGNSYPDATSDASTSKIARPSGTCTGLVLAKNGAYTFPFAPLTDTGFKRGFLTRVSEYSETGLLTNQKRMVYDMPQSEESIKCLKYEFIVDAGGNTIFYYSPYVIPVNQSRILSQEFVTSIGDQAQADSTMTSTQYEYNEKNMLVRTIQTSDDGFVVEQNVKYAMDFPVTSPTPGDTAAAAIFKLNSTNRYGEIIETFKKVTPYLDSGKIVGAEMNIFQTDGSNVWPYKQKHLPPGAEFTASSLSGTTTQSFVSAPDYILDATVEYANGVAINQIGNAMIPTGIHYATNSKLPIASLVNCKSENAIYEGFEMVTGRGLTSTGAVPSSLVEVRTGEKSLPLTNFFVLNSAAVDKSETRYRISVWAYSTAGNVEVTIKAKNGATTQQTLVLSYPSGSANQWAYLEGIMDMTAVSNSFTFEVSASGSIRLDDFVAIPASASINFNTIRPLTGPTSHTDDRGNSTVIVYDAMGRKINTLDKNRNLVELQEYGLQKQGNVTLNANFTSDVTSYVKGQTVTFTAAPTCLSGVNYEWVFTDFNGTVTTATGQHITKSFVRFGAHTAQLTVSKAGYVDQTFTDNICVNPDLLTVDVSVSPSDTWDCNHGDERLKTFTAHPSWTAHGLIVSYNWYLTDISGNWVSPITIPANPYVVSLNDNEMVVNSPSYDYSVRCDVYISSSSESWNNDCRYYGAEASGTSYVTYTTANCQ